MRTLLFFIFISVATFGNTNPVKENTIIGLQIVSHETKALGRHIYIVSNYYVEKKVEIINSQGKVLITTVTLGSPICLSKFEPGIYKIKVTENNVSQTLEYEVE
jgi:hypothetical protein